jgi:hypothetical protein
LKEGRLSYRTLVAGARATMMVAGTAAAVGMALANGRRLEPAFAQAAPAMPRLMTAPALPVAAPGADARAFIAQRFALATMLAIAGIVIAASLPAITTFALSVGDRAPAAVAAPLAGPPEAQRAGASVSGGWERAYTLALPPADDVAAAVAAGAAEAEYQALRQALATLNEQRIAQEAARTRAAAAATNPTRSLNRASGYAAGTVLRARVTIYGCTGPGGGFCGGMASGVGVFEGAAACSHDLPFGTKLRIIGDPTGRTYECLDRGALSATWVDVFFHDTSAGMAWASQLGGTVADIEIVN